MVFVVVVMNTSKLAVEINEQFEKEWDETVKPALKKTLLNIETNPRAKDKSYVSYGEFVENIYCNPTLIIASINDGVIKKLPHSADEKEQKEKYRSTDVKFIHITMQSVFMPAILLEDELLTPMLDKHEIEYELFEDGCDIPISQWKKLGKILECKDDMETILMEILYFLEKGEPTDLAA